MENRGRETFAVLKAISEGSIEFDASSNAIPALCAVHDRRFRSITAAGNRAFSAGHAAIAASTYAQALEEAQAVFSQARQHGGAAVLVAPMLLNIACQNLAFAVASEGDEAGSRRWLVQAIEQLIDAAASVSCPLEMRLNCVRHLKHALKMLDDPADPPTPTDRANSVLVARATAIAADVLRVVEIARAFQGRCATRLHC